MGSLLSASSCKEASSSWYRVLLRTPPDRIEGSAGGDLHQLLLDVPHPRCPESNFRMPGLRAPRDPSVG